MTTIEQLHAKTKALEADFRAAYMDANNQRQWRWLYEPNKEDK